MPSDAPFTISQVAERYGVSVGTVLTWIRDGSLKAVNVSRKANSRKPRYRISQKALDDFEQSRAAAPAPAPTRRTSRKQSAGVIKFY